ncbi:hypothetical protein [Sphingobacterium sp. E70]|nr:hypothetical protein [Sphingobacterium sp. E70]
MEQNSALHPADIAEEISRLNKGEQHQYFMDYPLEDRLEIFSFWK